MEKLVTSLSTSLFMDLWLRALFTVGTLGALAMAMFSLPVLTLPNLMYALRGFAPLNERTLPMAGAPLQRMPSNPYIPTMAPRVESFPQLTCGAASLT